MKQQKTRWRQKGVLLGGLYISQTLGLAFVTTSVPVIMRQAGAGLDKISLIFVLGLLWSIKFMWAPLIDRYGSMRLGHYRGWILTFQIMLIAATVCASGFSIQTQINVLSVLFTVMAFCAATQDIATDGLAVTLLKPEERAIGSSVQSAGNMIGFMLGGGLVLIAYHWLNWQGSLLLLALCMTIPLISVLRFKEQAIQPKTSQPKFGFKALINFFKRPNIWRWIPILLLFRINFQVTYWLLNPFLVDHGWSIGQIGIALNIIGLLFGVLGAVLGGSIIIHRGRKTTMLIAMVFGILATLGFIGLILGWGSSMKVSVYLVIGLVMVTYGLSSTVIYTVIMDKCNPSNPATDFTLQWSLTGISAMIFGGLAMALAEFIGYAGVLSISIISAVFVMILISLYNEFDVNYVSGIQAENDMMFRKAYPEKTSPQ